MRYNLGVTYGCEGERESLSESDNYDIIFEEYRNQIERHWCEDGPTFNIIDNETGKLYESGLWYEHHQY